MSPLPETAFGGSTCALAILYAALLPLCAWLMRSAFRAVDPELDEAAGLDGASR